jgi:hypothetical protein
MQHLPISLLRSDIRYLLLLCGLLGGAAQPPPALQRLEVQSVELAEVSTDRVRLRVRLGGIAERDIAVRTLTFDDASLNGIPLFSPPVSGPLRIARGASFSDAGVLEASIYYRDLASLEPVRRMVREEKALVRATVRLQPDLSLVQRIALWTSNAWVSWKVERIVTVQLPGGRAGKTAAELALAGADAVWVVGKRGFEWRLERDAFTKELRQKYASRVLPVETRYTVVKGAQKSPLAWRGLGFHAGGDEVIVPAEAVEPWMFDAAVAEALAAGTLEIIPESVDVIVSGFSLRKGTLTVAGVGRDKGKGLSVERRKTFALRDRASDANLARLRVAGLQGARLTETTDTGDAAVFRLREGGGHELLMVSTAMENGRPRLLDPVDSRAFGSPVIHPAGVLGIVVGQTTVASLREPR